MHDVVTTALDVLGLLLLAAGVYFLLEPHIGRAAFMFAGVVVIAGSGLAAWRHETARRPKRDRERA